WTLTSRSVSRPTRSSAAQKAAIPSRYCPSETRGRQPRTVTWCSAPAVPARLSSPAPEPDPHPQPGPSHRRAGPSPHAHDIGGTRPHDFPDQHPRRTPEPYLRPVVARRRRLPGLPPLLRGLERRRHGRPARHHLPPALPRRPRRRCDLALALLHLAAEGRRLRRGRLHRRRPPLRHPRRRRRAHLL